MKLKDYFKLTLKALTNDQIITFRDTLGASLLNYSDSGSVKDAFF